MTATDVVVVGAEPFGPNAIRFRFSDGHARGIFPFTYLRDIEASIAASNHAAE